MAFERQWASIAPRAFTANGTTLGVVTVASTTGFRVKMNVVLANTANPTVYGQFQVKRVISKTQLLVGIPDNKVPGTAIDISAYTVADGAVISAAQQNKNAIPDKDHYEAIYEADPVVADRVILVDENGDLFGEGNPLPIEFDGTISVGKVQVEGENGNTIEPNPNGSINVVVTNSGTVNVVKNTYGTALAVAAGIETTITQYVVPNGLTNALLQRVSVSGENVGRYRVFVNGVVIDTRRTYYGGSFNEYFEFSTDSSDGTTLVPGDLVAVKVLHNRPFTGNFESRIQALEMV